MCTVVQYKSGSQFLIGALHHVIGTGSLTVTCTTRFTAKLSAHVSLPEFGLEYCWAATVQGSPEGEISIAVEGEAVEGEAVEKKRRNPPLPHAGEISIVVEGEAGRDFDSHRVGLCVLYPMQVPPPSPQRPQRSQLVLLLLLPLLLLERPFRLTRAAASAPPTYPLPPATHTELSAAVLCSRLCALLSVIISAPLSSALSVPAPPLCSHFHLCPHQCAGAAFELTSAASGAAGAGATVPGAFPGPADISRQLQLVRFIR